MNIYLIGYRCTGKTTIGKALARRLSMPFIDMDDAIVEKEGRTIARMVAEDGWEYFRARERDAVAGICQSSVQVAATGGGVVLDEANVRQMKTTGAVVWLRARPETIIKWLEQDERTGDYRPALTDGSVVREIEETLTARTPLYEAAADFYIHTDGFDVDELCAKIIEELTRRGFRNTSATEKGSE